MRKNYDWMWLAKMTLLVTVVAVIIAAFVLLTSSVIAQGKSRSSYLNDSWVDDGHSMYVMTVNDTPYLYKDGDLLFEVKRISEHEDGSVWYYAKSGAHTSMYVKEAGQ